MDTSIIRVDEKTEIKKNPVLGSKLQDEVLNYAAYFLANQRSLLTAIEYKKDLKVFITFLSRHAPEVNKISELKKNHLIKYKTFLEISRLAPATIHRRLSFVSEFIKYLSIDGVVSKDLFFGIKRPKVINLRETLAFTDDEVKKILSSIGDYDLQGKFHHAVLSFAFGTGLRSSELRFLKKGDLAVFNGFNVIRVKTKGQKILELPIHEFVFNSLTRYLDALECVGIKLWDHDFLFQSPPKRRVGKGNTQISSKPIHHSTLDYILKKYARSLALKTGAVYRVSPHSIRATVATSLLKSGESLDSVQRVLNHSRISTTQKYDKRAHSVEESAVLKVSYFK